MSQNKLPYLCAWAATDLLSLSRYQKLQRFFQDLPAAWQESNLQSLTAAGLEAKFIEKFLDFKTKINPQKEFEKLHKYGLKLIFWEDTDYPLLLKEIKSPPLFLFVKGNLQKDELNLAVVGARQITTYGKQVCQDLVKALATQGITIVSGLAIGVDSYAHRAALETKGRTIAVLGNGLDQIYPAQNRNLAEKILTNGAILSEFPLGMPPHHYNFPRRNRIISGLSLGTLVIEAQNKSGSLITAHNAIEQNREIFAVPGSIYNPKSAGTNQLIQKGEAKPVHNMNDILEELNLNLVKSQNIVKTIPANQNLNHDEKIILETLAKENCSFDALYQETKLNSAILATALTLLEMKGYVCNLGNNQWIYKRN